MPAPSGAGINSAITIPGDSQITDVSSGNLLLYPKQNNSLQYQYERRRPRINLFMNGKAVFNLQLDQLTNQQKEKIINLLGGLKDDEPYQNILVTESDLIEIQNILAPYPQTSISASSMPNGVERKQIIKDTSTPIIFSQNSTTNSASLQNIIRRYCRYLVILGVVFGCLFVVFAAVSMQFSDKNSGGRIISTTAGLMLLLMGYSIWKVIVTNEKNARGEVIKLDTPPLLLPSRSIPEAIIKIKSDDSFYSVTNANLLSTPANIERIKRSGLPLLPLGDAH